jgi:FKBP-type peptidyl-prolyl cis-trans isomerase FklB
MKYIIILVLGITLAASSCLAGDPINQQDNKDKVSYSIGYQVGSDFRKQEIEIKPEMVIQGIEDAMAGSVPQMTPEEMRTTLMDLQQKVVEVEMKKAEETAEKNRVVGEKFLAENGKREGVVTLPSGLQYEIIESGTGATPAATDVVKVHYRGTLIDGTEFDSSYKRGQPAQFQVDGVIAGWTEALQLMREGAKWELYLPPDLAFGSRGPLADQTVIYEIELLGVNGEEQGSEPRSALKEKQQ